MPGGIRDCRARQRGVGTCRAMLRLDVCRPQIEIGRDTTIGMLKKRAMLDSSGADSLDASEYALTPNASPHSGGRAERLSGCVVVPATC